MSVSFYIQNGPEELAVIGGEQFWVPLHEINCSNANAGKLIGLLSLNDDGLCGDLSVEDMPGVLQRLLVLLNKDGATSHVQEAPSVHKGDTGPTVINCGVDAEYFERRLSAFRDMILLAMDINEKIVWG